LADLAPSAALPSETSLAAEFGVVRNTVRRALAQLEREGLIVTLPGRGRVASESAGTTVTSYRRIAEDLRQQIASSELTTGQRMPSEPELMRRYGVSRGTVRQGLALLEAAGLVTAVHGIGRLWTWRDAALWAKSSHAGYSRLVKIAAKARELARSLLEPELPRRWAHSRGVAGQAVALRRLLSQYADLLEAAAWLHDIGYASPLAVAGFHPLDGARHLRETGFGDRTLWTLVAHHTCAEIEAEVRGLGEVLAAEFPLSEVDPFLVAALTYCDMTIGPDGNPLTVDQRITEILSRYGPDDVVRRAIAQATPILCRQTAEISAALEAV
jgi:DNA-binding FadR family transcriptional regulator